MRISIGIHVHEEPTRLIATLESVKLNSEPETELLLLKDGPDPATCATLARLSGFVQLGTSKRLGPSACFNKLAANCDAEVLVLLESGSIVGPGWIHRILAAMAADPNIGLAGPTTNHVWNEQGVCRKSSGSPEEVAHTAREVAHRFGFAVRTLEPLYSLADFCYVVRREVIDVVGAADEQYANGPCWEMDYNIRAARAGFMGIWVCGAYVHRLPITKKRIQDEISLTEANKRRYQDKFCRMKLEAKTGDYCQHCQGDACDNFAPKELIQIQLPINQAANPDLGRKKKDRALDLTDPVDLPSVSEAENCPLVSCIMPTYNRRPFVSLAIKYFLHQDYPNRELIIVDDGTDPIVDLVPENPCIRYIRLEQKTTIGAKRNLACKEARGDIVMHWGDDDWMSNWRIRYQVKSLSKKQADICGLKRVFFCDLERGEAWQYSYSGKGKAWVAGGTLCYKKSFWSANPFPEICDGEDTHFIWSDHSKRVLALEDSTFYVALIHSETTRHKRKANLLWHPHTTEEIQKII
jgi:glycosyltransferase involved in cell wall biosynthesis